MQQPALLNDDTCRRKGTDRMSIRPTNPSTMKKGATCSNPSRRRRPSPACAICGKPLETVGGQRIVGQHLRGVALSKPCQGGGNKDFPHQSVKLSDDSEWYVVVWGEKDKWTESTIETARAAYLGGNRPWFCQICAERKCSQCGAPITVPMGSDILCDNGCVCHTSFFPFDPGCINHDCEKYREWGSNQDGSIFFDS